MAKLTLTELLQKDELDLRQELSERPDSRIWYLVEKELGGAYVIGTLASGGGAAGSSVMDVRSISNKSVDADKTKLRLEKFIAGFNLYDRLAKLGESEIETRYSDSVRHEMEREQQEYITKRRLKADFPYWLKMATWNLEEGAALIHGLEPRTIKPSLRDPTRERFPILKSWLECREHAFRALRAGQLKDNSKPVEFLTWAEPLGYSIPVGLQALFERIEVAERISSEIQPVSATTLKKLKRSDALSPLITRAIKECESHETSAVWNRMCEYARNKETPLYGITEEGLQYYNQSDEPRTFSKKALLRRLKRIISPDKSR